MERMREQKNGKRKKKKASFPGIMGGGICHFLDFTVSEKCQEN